MMLWRWFRLLISPGRVLRVCGKHLRRREYDAFIRASRPQEAPAVVVGGCPRSGTTLAAVILDSHPNLCCPPETALFFEPWRDAQLAFVLDTTRRRIAALRRGDDGLSGFIARAMADYAARRKRPRWAEKSPDNVCHLDYLFECFPRARFVHVIRDGRDVVCSLRRHPSHERVRGKLVPRRTDNPLDRCARQWARKTRAGLAWRGHPGYFELRYEQLVADPEPTLRKLFEFLGEPWDPAVLNFHAVEGKRRDPIYFPQSAEATRPINAQPVGRWRRDLSADEIALVKPILNPLLIELGYVDGPDWPDRVKQCQMTNDE